MLTYAQLHRQHFSGVIRLCKDEAWPSYTDDPEVTWKALSAPGVTTVVALDGDGVVGFAQMQSDGLIQAHLSLIVVAKDHRMRGIGRRLVEEAFARCGGKRVDLVSTEGADSFYQSFDHRLRPGYRIYPGLREGEHGPEARL